MNTYVLSSSESVSSKTESPAANELLIVDPGVENVDLLLTGLTHRVDVLELTGGEEPLFQIAAALKARPQTDTLHILAHGEPGALVLSGSTLDAATLAAQSSALGIIKTALAGSAKLALWACSTAAGKVGESFIGALEAATGADVFASLTPVGNAAKGGTWDIGIASPFGTRALAAYPHTLPTFDFTGGTGSGTATYTETESGVTITVVDDDGDLTNVFNAGTAAGLSNEAIAFGGTGSLTVTFDEGVTVTSFRYVEDDGSLAGTDSVIFTPTGGTGTTITKTATDFANSGFDITPTDWVGVTGFTVTYTGGTPIDPILDTIVFNVAPTVSGEPTDIAFTEDTAGDVDLSAVTVADGDGDSLTVTLSVDAGTFSTPADGALVGAGVTETLVNATTITLAGTAADINTYLDTASNITYTGATDAEGGNVATLTITPNDGTEDGTAATVNIDITNVNDAPTISGLASDFTVTEDAASNLDLSAVTVADVDGDSLTMSLVVSAGTLTSAFGDSLQSGVLIAGTGTSTITLTGSASDITSILDNVGFISYTGAADANGEDAATLTLTANDSTVDSSDAVANFDITNVNDDPTISGLVSNVTVTEDTASDLDLSASSFGDIDSAGDIVVTLTAGSGTMAASGGGGVVVGGTGTGTLTLTGTITEINTYLDTASNIQYTGATDVEGDNASSISVTANDGDGSGDVALGTFNVDITNVNDDPTISGLASDIALTEDTVGNIDLSASAFADVDTTGNVTVTLTASEGTFSTPANGAGVGAGVTETLVNATTVTLVGTVDDINTYLNTASNIQYTGATNDNGADTSTITVTINDGAGSGDVAAGTINLDITAVNDDPTGSNATLNTSEDSSHTLTAANFGFGDVDSGDTLVSVRIDVQSITSGTLQLSGTDVGDGDIIAVADINAGNLVYTPAPDANGAGLLSFTFSVNDGTAFAASTSTITVDVADVAEPIDDPVVIRDGADNSALVGGNSNDTLIGGAGDDSVTAGDGDDILYAGPDDDGNDTISAGGGDDIAGGGAGDDFIEGDDGSDTLYGGSGNDTIYATSKENENGDDSTNTIWAGSGNDSVSGGLGNDTLGGGSGDDQVGGGGGSDTLFGSTGDDILAGDDGNDTLFGGADADNIDGGSGDDLLFGGAGADTVAGGTGNDTLWAGAGDDTLTGGAGADIFTFGATSGNDQITDFSVSEDTLDLSFSSLDDLAAVTAAASAATMGGNSGVLIDLGDGESIFIQGLTLSDLASINLEI